MSSQTSGPLRRIGAVGCADADPVAVIAVPAAPPAAICSNLRRGSLMALYSSKQRLIKITSVGRVHERGLGSAAERALADLLARRVALPIRNISGSPKD